MIAQEAAAPAVAAPAGVVSYPGSFYEQFRPASAKEMVENTPGFVLTVGEEVRGYGGAAGNVLIDGQRPASKSVPLDMQLQRISPASVERIEVIRGGVPGIDMQGQSVLANVVRRTGAQASGASQVVLKPYDDGFVGISTRVEGAWRAGQASADGQLAFRREYVTGTGDGRHARTRSTGQSFEAGAFDSRILSKLYQANGAGEYRSRLGTVRLNASAERDVQDRRDIARVTPLAGPSFDDLAEILTRKTDLELGVDYERGLGGGLELNLLALQRLGRETVDALSTGRSATQVSDENAKSRESIARAAVKMALPHGVALEAGAEGAFNSLDAKSALTVGGAPVVLPSANVRVEEWRAEGFATATLRPASFLNLETGLRVETSTISQTGGATQEKTFTFIKPRAIATWDAGWLQVRARLERVVGQLNFEDFAASSEFEAGTVNAGNADLEPERWWIGELAFEKRFWGSGALVVTLSHAKVEQVVDLIPIDGRFDAPGNIGPGVRDEAKVTLSIPLERLGLKRSQLRANGTWRASEVTDPVTGETRRISGERPFEGGFLLTRSLPSLKSTISLESEFGYRETFYRINEIRMTEEAPNWKVTWDWTPRPDLMFRLQLDNATARDRVRTRTTFVGPRSAGQINFRERRQAQLYRMLFIRARKLF